MTNPANNNMKIQEYDSSEYDTEAMEIDERNGNFSPERAEEYRHENIVQNSFINGQFTQARQQCRSFGLNYELEFYKFQKGEPAL